MKNILFLSLAFLMSFCKPSKNTVSTEVKPGDMKTASNGEKTSENELVISFFSKGAGIDSKAVAAVQSVLDQKSKDWGDKLVINKTPWGREGEVDFCLNLEKLSKKEKGKLEKALKEAIGSSELVHFGKTKCHEKR